MKHVCSFAVSLVVLLASLTSVAGEERKTPRTDLYGDPLPPGAIARLGTIRLRHAEADLAFSKNGKHLLSFGCDGELREWDMATGELRRRKRLANAYSREVALSPDGTKAAAWCGTEVILYDTTTGEERGRKPAGRRHFDYGYDPLKLLAFSPDNK
ncbi:MAG: WD40 repeat domain-containing protein, partial [Gemmataceae bacterium]